ncbi:MAG TPA: O-antigen ligase family protein [Vicinamibacteria bacterium]|nr:O-antigen ligase family protein [Vicinamibacteria bacterium]
MSLLSRLMCALVFVGWTAEWPLATDKVLYCGYWRSPFQLLGPLFTSVPGLGLFPWQLALLALAPFCLLRPGALRRRAPLLDLAIVLSLASLAVTFLWGVTRGGSAYNAYYQLWRFLVALLVALLVVSAIRGSRDVKALGATVLLAALVRATLAIYFYWGVVRGRIDPMPPYMTTHDDTLLFVAGIVVVLSWALARERTAAWLSAALATGYILYAVILNDRRLAWIEILLALAVMYFVLPRGRVHRRVNRALLFAAPLLVVYVIVGWGREGGIFEPVHALSTAGSDEDSSSLARQEEIRNLLYTLSVAGNPLLGTGWGMPYQKLTSVYANFGPEWWQYLYMPHNSLLALAVFGGLVGLGGIWLVVPVSAFLAMRGYRGSTHPVDRAGAMAALCVLPAYGAQCYGDLGFQSLTGGLVLGVALGVAGKVSAWAAAPAPPSRPRPRPALVARY